MNSTWQPELYRSQGGTLYITEEEAADFYWLVVFLPSAIVFFASALYLVAGWWFFLSFGIRYFLNAMSVISWYCTGRLVCVSY